MRVALIGSTGLVGSQLVPLLRREGHELHLLQRRKADVSTQEVRVHVAQAEQWPKIVSDIAPEAAVSALGTTMKKAGSEAGFRAVDHDMVLAFAAAARAAGTCRFGTVSSVGADTGSRNFYLRMKGETEEALAALRFERLDIFRPGLLRGRRGSDRRLGERIGIAISPLVNLLLRGPLQKYAAIDAHMVAGAVAASLSGEASGVFIHDNLGIRLLIRR